MTDTQGTVTFISSHQPALKAGEYRITVTQRVSSTDAAIPLADAFSDTKYFSVRGRRFSLDPSVVDSIYPPPNAIGDFSRFLPHIVLKQRTLPWEREPGGAAKPGSRPRPLPWLALLLFDESAPIVEYDQIMVGDLQSQPYLDKQGAQRQSSLRPGMLSYTFDLEPGESYTDSCAAIDVPVGLFHRLLPSRDDLQWLAHARQVDMGNKPRRTGDTTGDFAVLVANRLPLASPTAGTGTKHSIHLVSLHGLGMYLPGALGQPADWFASEGAAIRFVRLVSLKKWTFTNTRVEHSFRSFLENLNRTDGRPVQTNGDEPRLIPFSTLRRSAGTALHPSAAAALSMGYTPLNHHLRNGADVVSWYRGPLVSYSMTPPQAKAMVACADAALGYDPDTGMFDVSYAAAWQLGRLLALSSTAFSTSLVQWKKRVRDTTHASANPAPYRSSAALRQQIIDILSLPPASPTVAESTDDIAPQIPDVPTDVAAWLGDLALLYPVPFQYLAADAAMVPSESIQFFYLNPTWIARAIDGACSLGSNTRSDVAQDRSVADKVYDAAFGATRNTVITGFVLRSDVVSSWPGLEINGSDGAGADLPILRMSVMAPNVLLVLFSGVVSRVAVHQPPEGLHFGVNEIVAQPTSEDRDVEVRLRSLAGDHIGSNILSATGVRLSSTGRFRSRATQVIAVDGLAANLERDLRAHTAIDGDLDSGAFAVQMIEGVDMVVFEIAEGRTP